jgi:hypothetical protein
MTTLAPRLLSSAMMALLSNALSAISTSKANPSISGEALSRQQREAHEIAERIGERQDFGGHTTFGTADGLA